MTATATAATKTRRTTRTTATLADKARRASTLIKQASDPTRLQILMLLSEGELHVGALCESLGQTQPAVSHHLALLRHSGLIMPRRQGKNNFYQGTDKGRELADAVRGLVG